MTDAKPTRWYHLTPDRFVIGLLIVEGLLWLSERLGWLAWHKGYAALVAVATVGAVFLSMLLWFAVALVFRLRFQFSIRSMLVLTVVVTLPFSWLAVEMKRAKEQKAALAVLVETGGGYEYDWRFDASGDYASKPEPPVPEGLWRPLGIDFFAEVVRASVVSTPTRQVTNPDLSPLERLRHLRSLWLDRSQLTDAELEHLKSLSQLKSLSLSDTKVTDRGVQQLTGLRQLECLNLDGCNITDLGLEYIITFPELKYVSLCRTRIMDGDQKIAKLTHLRDLRLDRTYITDAALRSFKVLTELKYLFISSPNIAQNGVKDLQRALPTCLIVGWKTAPLEK